MKRSAVALAILFVVAVFSGCSLLIRGMISNAPLPAATETQPATTPSAVDTALASDTGTLELSAPEGTEPKATTVIPTTNIYASAGLALTFTVPAGWVGKFSVEDGGDYLSVYFNPATPYAPNVRDGELFTIEQEDSEDMSYGGDWEFKLGGVTYAWGSINGIDGVDYNDFEPEYNTYMAMVNNVPAVFDTVRSLSGQAPLNVKKLWIKAVPTKPEYTTSMGLGIKFTLPKSWLDKCRIEEDANSVSFFFKPKKPNPAYGDGLLLMITKKTGVEGEEDGWNGVQEFNVGGIAYFSGAPAEASYKGPEQKTFDGMQGGIQAVVNSVKAVN